MNALQGDGMKESARFFKVLSDEARLAMIWLLFHHRELCVCDFMEVLGITQSKASRHLAALRNAGVATGRKEGLWSYYSLRPAGDPLVDAHMKLLKSSLARRQDARRLTKRLDAWLGSKQPGAPCGTAAQLARTSGRRR